MISVNLLTADTADVLTSISHFLWPLVAAVVIWRLFPAISDVIRSRSFSVKVGGAEITVQAASEQLHEQIGDLQRQFAQLVETAPDAAAARDAAVPGVDDVSAPQRRLLERLLWVDDEPNNNAYLIKTIRDLDVDVVIARSTREAIDLFGTAQKPFDAVVSDLARWEAGSLRPQAGVDLLVEVRHLDADVPVFMYASARGMRASGEAARSAGATLVTSSPTELLSGLERIGLPVAAGQR